MPQTKWSRARAEIDSAHGSLRRAAAVLKGENMPLREHDLIGTIRCVELLCNTVTDRLTMEHEHALEQGEE